MEKNVWFSRRALKLHAVILILVPAFMALCIWQVTRALGGNSLSWAYVFEWPIFAGYAVYMWWRLVHEAADAARRRSLLPTTLPAAQTPPPRQTPCAWRARRRRRPSSPPTTRT